MPRRPLRRAAVLGTTAHVARKRGEAQGAAAAAQAPPSVQDPPPAQTPEPAPAEDRYGDLMKLKDLLDAGALTQAEFDAEKQKLLGS